MNGRIYDPLIGRFLSADPMIHDVTNGQDLNRYSYVHNNPLSYTDMNGYGFFKSIGKFFKKFWRVLLAAVVAYFLPQLLPTIIPGSSPAAIFLNGAITSGITGGVSSVIVTGRPKAFLSGFGQAFLTYGVGHGLFPGNPRTGKVSFGSGQHFGRVIGHGVIGGTFAEIHGGRFSAGFSAAAFTAAAGPILPQDFWGGFAASTAIGCGSSVLGGGKCGEGAATAAFVYLFNEAATTCKKAGTVGCRLAPGVGGKLACRAAVEVGCDAFAKPPVAESVFDVDPDTGKITDSELPGAGEISDAEIEKAIEELEESIGARERDQSGHNRGNPNGNPQQRADYRQYQNHQERIRRETELLEALKGRRG